MSIRIITAAAAIAMIAGTAGAQSVNLGDAQLARSAGVEPGVYSTSQLTQIIEAQEENDPWTVAFIKRQANDTATRALGYANTPVSGYAFGNGDHNNNN